ncbi:AarF/ABC1/UbiB kinase family protein [Nocardia uniformis]|uniref:AarF/ABC1/UbiB kinase family protein n=1 Tax=Nocardia uniformis TaxID=53432 RepID=A0A849CCJ7_9NOCA|nr:AarF/ABC1/UbiB kinase family protein [Nocardia uniformis]NNH72749.1 AarF/ABC1/UbiB kinase family protein [Nocardia uniformis]
MSERIPTSRVRRGAKLGKLAANQAKHSAGLKLAVVGKSPQQRAAQSERAILAAAEDLVAVLGSMKGLAMKLGQMLSMIDLNLIPAEYQDQFRDKLAALCDQAPKMPFARMRKVLEGDLERPLGKVFTEFDETPIAAASIGQVYRARLLDGRVVAVKIQYPGVDLAVRADLKNFSLVMRLARAVAPGLADSAVAQEFVTHLADEVDYRIEAENQQAVAALYQDHPFIRIPGCVQELCTAHVLVTEMVEGIGFDGIKALPQTERDLIGEIVFRFYLGSIARFGQFAGDPHPGNVLLAPDGTVVFLDFGLFKHMTAEAVGFELACMRAAGEYRGADLRELLVEYGVLEPDSPVTADECLRFFRENSGWFLTDAEIRVTGDTAANAVLAAFDPTRGFFQLWRDQRLPAEHALARRVEYMTVGLLGKLGASANWHRIAREWMYDTPPRTPLGAQEESWLANRRDTAAHSH